MSLAKQQLFEELLSRLKSSLKKNGLKNTAQREIILRALIQKNEHVTPDEVLTVANKLSEGAQIGMATVYRTLNFFEQEGLVSSISFGIDGKKYELNTKDHHDHMICDICDKIIEFSSDEIENIQSQIAHKHGFEIKWHAMQLHGICKECDNKSKGKK